MKYHNKSVVIEAVKWTGKNIYEIQKFAGNTVHDIYKKPDGTYDIWINMDGLGIRPVIGMYIVKAFDGGFYLFDSEFFEKRYEPLEE